MIAIALALSAALAFGVSDFTAGLASRRAHFVGDPRLRRRRADRGGRDAALDEPDCPRRRRRSVGFPQRAGHRVGSVALYRGLSRGEMSVAGPISAVGAAILPALVGVFLGDRLSPLAIAGAIVALPAIWLVSRAAPVSNSALLSDTALRSRPSFRAGAIDGVIAGLGFGVLFIGLNRAGSQDGLWPVAAAETSALLVIGLAIAVTRPARPTRQSNIGWLSITTGILGIVGSIAYFYATQLGILTLAAIVTSLYPAFTVLLAFLVLHERPSRTQLVGLSLCAVAIAGIVAS